MTNEKPYKKCRECNYRPDIEMDTLRIRVDLSDWFGYRSPRITEPKPITAEDKTEKNEM